MAELVTMNCWLEFFYRDGNNNPTQQQQQQQQEESLAQSGKNTRSRKPKLSTIDGGHQMDE